jgi:hypothetical protein
MFKKLRQQRQRRCHKPPKINRRVFFEPLEDRRMLAAEIEPNGSFADAQSLTFSSGVATISGGINNNADEADYFKLVTTSAGTVHATLTFSNTNGNIDLYLYDSTEHEIDRSTTSQDKEEVSGSLNAGTYYVKVAPKPRVSSVSYQLSVEVGASNPSGASLSIAAISADKNEENTGQTSFTFTVTRGGDTSGQTTVDWAVTGTGTTPANASDFVGNAFPGDSLTFDANETTKTITVKVVGDTTSEPDEGFVVTLNNASGGASITTASANGVIRNDDAGGGNCPTDVVCDQEENDTFAIAQPLGTKTKIQGTMEVAKGTGSSTIGQAERIPDPDFYKFTTAALGTYKITANVDPVDRIAHTPTLTLYDSGHQVIERQVLTSSTPAVSITKPLAAGDYFISFSGERNYSGSNVLTLTYEIDVERISTGGGSGGGSGTICDANGNCVEQENNDTKNNANILGSLAGPITLTGKLEVAKIAGNNRIAELTRIPGSDYFRFTVDQPGVYEGTANIDRLIHKAKVLIFDDTDNLLSTNVFGDDKTISIRGTLGVGTYYFQVTGAGNTSGSDVEPQYTITISPISTPGNAPFDDESKNDDPETPTDLGSLTGPLEINGQLEVSGVAGNNHLASLLRIPDSDYYAFTVLPNASSNVTIHLRVDRVQHRPTVNLYQRSPLELIATREVTSANLGAEFTQLLKSGEYLVEVTGKSNSSGSDVRPNYTLRLTPQEVLPPNAGIEQELPDGFTNDSFASAENLGTIAARRELRGHFDVKPGTGNSPIAMQTRIPDKDFYRFQVASEHTYLISVKNLNRLAHAPTLTLYRSDQSVIVSKAVQTINGATLEAKLTPGVDYYVSLAAEPNSTGSNVEFDYTLVVDTAIITEIKGTEIEGNDSTSAANDLGVLDGEVNVKRVNGTLSVRQGLGNSPIGQRERFPNPDYFHFKVDSEQDVAIGLTLDRFQHQPDLTLFDQNGVEKWSYGLPDAAGVLVRTNLAAGDYFVSVSADPNNSGSDVEPNYVLTLEVAAAGPSNGAPVDGFEQEANDSFVAANQIGLVKDFESILGSIHAKPAVGNNHLAEITSYPNSDFFAFSTEMAGSVTLLLTTDRLPFPITMSLFDSSKKLLESKRLVESRRLTLTKNLQPGDYFVVLNGPAVATGVNAAPDYTLSIDAPSPNLPPDKKELNDTFEKPTPISSSEELPDLSIHNATDLDYFKFTLAEEGSTANFIQITHSTGSGDADLDLLLYNANRTLIAQSSTTDPIERISLAGLAVGTYYAEVLGYKGSIAAYDLQFELPVSASSGEIAPDAFEPNDDFVGATALQAIEGRVSFRDLTIHTETFEPEKGPQPNSDYFSFQLLQIANAAHFLRVVPESPTAMPVVQLYDASKNLIREPDATSGKNKISLANLPAGQYFVLVTSKSSTGFKYRIQFEAPSRKSGFDITFDPQSLIDVPVAVKSALFAAAQRWSQVIDEDLPNFVMPYVDVDKIREELGATFSFPAPGTLIDDLFVAVRIDDLDGPGGLIARAGSLKPFKNGTSGVGLLQYDLADLQKRLDNGTIEDVFFHELGHIITSPQTWGVRGLLQLTSESITGLGFRGPKAVSEYNQLVGNGSTFTSVPIEQNGGDGTALSHWDEEIFQDEIFTGYAADHKMPLSRLTIGLVEDIGYPVTYDAAEPYLLPSPRPQPTANSNAQTQLTEAPPSIFAGLASAVTEVERVALPLSSQFQTAQQPCQLARSQDGTARDIAPNQVQLCSFTLAGRGTADHSFSVTSTLPDPQSHPLYVVLKDASGNTLSAGLLTNQERVSLAGYPAGDYTVEIRSDDFNSYAFKFSRQSEAEEPEFPAVDIDGDGEYKLISDYLLFLNARRKGTPDDLLLDLAEPSSRTPALIKAIAESLEDALDIDGDRKLNLLSDGLLIVNAARAGTPAELIDELRSPDANRDVDAIITRVSQLRTTAPKVAANLSIVLPSASLSQQVKGEAEGTAPVQQVFFAQTPSVAVGESFTLNLQYSTDPIDLPADTVAFDVYFREADLDYDDVMSKLLTSGDFSTIFLGDDIDDDDMEPMTDKRLIFSYTQNSALNASHPIPLAELHFRLLHPTTINLVLSDSVVSKGFEQMGDSITVGGVPDVANFAISGLAGLSTLREDGTANGSFQVALNKQPASNVVLSIQSSDATEATPAPMQLTFTPQNWNAAQTVAVQGKQDTLDDGDISGTITVSVDDAQSDDEFDSVADQVLNFTTLDDDDSPVVPSITVAVAPAFVQEDGTANLVYTFTRTGDTTPALTANFDVSGNATFNNDYTQTGAASFSTSTGTVTFAAGSAIATVTIDPTADTNDENNETAILTVAIGPGYTIGTANIATGTIIDDDETRVPGFTIVESGGSTVVDESGTTDTFTVVLTAPPASNVVLDVRSSDTGEVAVVTPQLTFTPANWNVPQTVTVQGVIDGRIDGKQTRNVTVSVNQQASDAAYASVPPQSVAAMIRDANVGIPIDLTVAETGTAATFPLVLEARPISNLVLLLKSSDITEATVSPASITFTPDNWDTRQFVTVTGVDDELEDGDQTSIVTVRVDGPNSDDAFDALPDKKLTVLTKDDEAGASISGSVYADVNNNGRRDAGESGIANVEIRLSGAKDDVQLTDTNGNYSFLELTAGNYTITEIQPLAYIDGADTPGTGGGVAGNDVFQVTVQGLAQLQGYNFGERGLQAQFINLNQFLSRPPGLDGASFPANAEGEASAVTFRSTGNGQITIRAEGEATLELFDATLNSVARSVGGVLSTSLYKGEGYVLYVSSGGTTKLHAASNVGLETGAIAMHNRGLTTDVNFDGTTSPLDALIVINYLNAPSNGLAYPTFADVSGDRLVSPLDVLQVINFLNSNTVAVNAEGEAEAARPIVIPIGTSAFPSAVTLDALNVATPRQSGDVIRTVVAPQSYAIVSPREIHNRLFARSGEAAEDSDDLETAIDAIANDLAELWQ